MPATCIQLSADTKDFIRKRLVNAGSPAATQGSSSRILAAFADVKSSIFYDTRRYPVTIDSPITP